ncbi:MAG: hypothetical protein JWR63_2110 [Conexibacter sp.]|nr:hypothetical protein [Conexibacter sp.]
MSTHKLGRILCLAEPRGDVDTVERVLLTAVHHRADAVARSAAISSRAASGSCVLAGVA